MREAVAEALRPTPNKTIHIASEILLLLLPLYSCSVSQKSESSVPRDLFDAGPKKSVNCNLSLTSYISMKY